MVARTNINKALSLLFIAMLGIILGRVPVSEMLNKVIFFKIIKNRTLDLMTSSQYREMSTGPESETGFQP